MRLLRRSARQRRDLCPGQRSFAPTFRYDGPICSVPKSSTGQPWDKPEDDRSCLSFPVRARSERLWNHRARSASIRAWRTRRAPQRRALKDCASIHRDASRIGLRDEGGRRCSLLPSALPSKLAVRCLLRRLRPRPEHVAGQADTPIACRVAIRRPRRRGLARGPCRGDGDADHAHNRRPYRSGEEVWERLGRCLRCFASSPHQECPAPFLPPQVARPCNPNAGLSFLGRQSVPNRSHPLWQPWRSNAASCPDFAYPH